MSKRQKRFFFHGLGVASVFALGTIADDVSLGAIMIAAYFIGAAVVPPK